MRTWRVGSISMGAALVFLGIFLLMAQFLDWDPMLAILAWWPVLLIILGVEVIIYIAKSGKENTNVKYDFLSIIFIGMIGTVGLGMAALSVTGILERANHFVAAETRTMDLPKLEVKDIEGIERIVVETGYHPVTIESSSVKEFTVFGTYRSDVSTKLNPLQSPKDYAMVEKKGDTLYMKLKDLPHHSLTGLGGEALNATILVPDGIALEVNGGNHIVMKPRALAADWSVTGGNVQINLEEEPILVDVQNAHQLGEGQWEDVSQAEGSSLSSAKKKIGNGDHRLTVHQAEYVSLR